VRVHYDMIRSKNTSRYRPNVLADTTVIFLAAEQAMDDHNRVSFCAAFIVMEAVRKIDNPQARRRMERSCP
jgi:hypothetical protein